MNTIDTKHLRSMRTIKRRSDFIGLNPGKENVDLMAVGARGEGLVWSYSQIAQTVEILMPASNGRPGVVIVGYDDFTSQNLIPDRKEYIALDSEDTSERSRAENLLGLLRVEGLTKEEALTGDICRSYKREFEVNTNPEAKSANKHRSKHVGSVSL